MWLLSTDRAELRFFVEPEDVPQGYAILSHLWGPTETLFQDIRSIYHKCVETGENPRDHVSNKIRHTCIIAERDGFSWVWVDTCCIDRTSSAELSEAINAMFRYYSLAQVCYAYLGDLDSSQRLEGITLSSALNNCRWMWRGWTLLELIAPRDIIFLDASWRIVGSKRNLASVLEDITTIPRSVLMDVESLQDISIEDRMAWADRRSTTRREDAAYCLMGIFNVNMPVLYGEGADKAFRRLRREIAETTSNVAATSAISLHVEGSHQAVLRNTALIPHEEDGSPPIRSEPRSEGVGHIQRRSDSILAIARRTSTINLSRAEEGDDTDQLDPSVRNLTEEWNMSLAGVCILPVLRGLIGNVLTL